MMMKQDIIESKEDFALWLDNYEWQSGCRHISIEPREDERALVFTWPKKKTRRTGGTEDKVCVLELIADGLQEFSLDPPDGHDVAHVIEGGCGLVDDDPGVLAFALDTPGELRVACMRLRAIRHPDRSV